MRWQREKNIIPKRYATEALTPTKLFLHAYSLVWQNRKASVSCLRMKPFAHLLTCASPWYIGYTIYDHARDDR